MPHTENEAGENLNIRDCNTHTYGRTSLLFLSSYFCDIVGIEQNNMNTCKNKTKSLGCWPFCINYSLYPS